MNALPLGDLCDVLDSRRKPITKRDRTSGKFPYYGATGILDYVGDYIFDEKLVLIGEDGAKWGAGENTAFAASGKYWVNNHAHVIRPHRDKVLDEWIIYYLNFSDLSAFVTGLTVPKLNQSKLREIPIPLPPLPEQRRIVAMLDEAFAGLAITTANTEKNLKNAREVFDSYLNFVFGKKGNDWVQRKIGDVASTQYGLSGTLNAEGKGYRIFRMGEVQDGALVDTGQMKFIDIGNAEFEQYRLIPGDVLFNRTNSSDLVGKTGLFSLKGDYCFASYLVRVHFDPSKVNTKFVSYLMNTSGFLARIRAKAARSVNQANINATILRNEMIDFPDSVKSQSVLAKTFDHLSIETKRLESFYKKKMSRLANLRQSILQKAFAGELTSPSGSALHEAAE